MFLFTRINVNNADLWYILASNYFTSECLKLLFDYKEKTQYPLIFIIYLISSYIYNLKVSKFTYLSISWHGRIYCKWIVICILHCLTVSSGICILHCLTCKPRSIICMAFSRWINDRTYAPCFAKKSMQLICKIHYSRNNISKISSHVHKCAFWTSVFNNSSIFKSEMLKFAR